MGEDKVEFFTAKVKYIGFYEEYPTLKKSQYHLSIKEIQEQKKSEARINLYENAEKYYGRVSKILRFYG